MDEEGSGANGIGPMPTTQGSPSLGAPAWPAVTASDLRQYVYCPRIIYFRYCAPVRPPPTYKMAEGRRQHERVEELEQRRSLRAYGLSDGERLFGVHLSSERLGIAGTMDMVILRRHEAIPVEFKHAEVRTTAARPRTAGRSPTPAEPEEAEEGSGAEVAVALHHKYQLAAYALLAEERWQLPAWRCFVYFVAARRAAEVAITPGMRDYTRRLLREMRQMIALQRMPPATRRVQRCWECEYRRFCNDVD